ncbi:MAG: 16S rRNA (guanine(527)-N(7))-methyltransferase RsmG [Oscillospiraceae bacterium]|nr:16S rRNA (guanine(527)-N(7))-methyltransferase RsmG [Oscillospiraceae bacterium]
MMEEVLKAEAARLGVALTQEQLALFRAFADALLEKNKVMNLTAITEPEAVAKLHFADCLELLHVVDCRGKSVIDVGCGAGFPGVPMKLGEPTIRLTLLDSLQKRVNWLRETLEALGVEATCIASRAEEYAAREQFDLAVSRAVARLNVLAELCLPFVKVGGYFLAMKGAAAEEELEEARHALYVLGGSAERTVEYEIDGMTRRVIVIRKERPTYNAYPRRFAKIKQQPL